MRFLFATAPKFGDSLFIVKGMPVCPCQGSIFKHGELNMLQQVRLADREEEPN